MISDAPIITPVVDSSNRSTFAWTGWYTQVKGALSQFDQTGTISNNGQAFLDLWDTKTGGTPATGSHWRIFADNVGGGGGNITLGFYDLAHSRVAFGFLDNGGVQFNLPANIVFAGGYSTWVPTVTPATPMSLAVTSVTGAEYIRIGPWVDFSLNISVVLSGTPSNMISITLPVNCVGAGSMATASLYNLSGSGFGSAIAYVRAAGQIEFYLPNMAAFTAGSYALIVAGRYRVA